MKDRFPSCLATLALLAFCSILAFAVPREAEARIKLPRLHIKLPKKVRVHAPAVPLRRVERTSERISSKAASGASRTERSTLRMRPFVVEEVAQGPRPRVRAPVPPAPVKPGILRRVGGWAARHPVATVVGGIFAGSVAGEALHDASSKTRQVPFVSRTLAQGAELLTLPATASVRALNSLADASTGAVEKTAGAAGDAAAAGAEVFLTVLVKILAVPAALLAAFFIFLWVMPFLGRPRIRKFVRERWSMMPWKAGASAAQSKTPIEPAGHL